MHRHTPLARGLEQILQQLQQRLGLEQTLVVYLAGGMAVHLYTGERVTTDIDAEFGVRIALPRDLSIEVSLDDGSNLMLYFDTNYNPMFSLMHERYQEDAIELELDVPHVRLFVLSPLDLAISKLARFADNDREDIAALVRAGLVTSEEMERRGTEALTGFVGGMTMVRMNLEDALGEARRIEGREA